MQISPLLLVMVTDPEAAAAGKAFDAHAKAAAQAKVERMVFRFMVFPCSVSSCF
jgi:hypothetical protein